PVTPPPAPLDFDTLLERARAHVRAGELDAAEALLRRALELRPGDRVAAQNLRVVLRRREAASDPSTFAWGTRR
ncbi:MAG TPA: tetratricopeptide repeat protein, partial [Nannocystis sp.]